MLLAATDVTAMSAFLDLISSFFTQALTWSGSVVTTILQYPALVVFCFAMPICGFAVGLLKRLISVG